MSGNLMYPILYPPKTFVKKKIMAKATGALMEEISDKQVLEKYPLPFELDFRMHPKKD